MSYLIVTARRTMMTPTSSMATQTPPIMYILSLGASEIIKLTYKISLITK